MVLKQFTHLNNINNTVKFPKKYINYLDNIYNETNKIKIIDLEDFKIVNEDVLNNNSRSILKSLVNNFDYTDKFKNKISNLQRVDNINYIYENTEVQITIYNNSKNNRLINDIIKITNYCITLFNRIHNPRKNVKIYILETNYRKRININRNNQLIEKNINTGYTQSFSDINQDYIVIYRTEELKKVLIHELIHLYNFHAFQRPTNLNINKLLNCNNSRFSIFECYTETIAVILYTFYYSKKYNMDFNKLMKNQLEFSFLQCAKLLYNQKIDTIAKLGKLPINETTNATSYFILKCSILNNLDLYKNIFNETKGISLYNKKINLFDENLIKSINNTKFKNNTSTYLELIKTNKINKELLQTFRMNILD